VWEKGHRTILTRTVNTILPCAQALLYTLMGLMPSPYQILSLKAVFAMFWEPQRVALPEQCVIKSPAALSRFFNEYGWPTRAVIRATRKQILKELWKYAPIGKRPHLQVIIDLTTLEKRGNFKAFAQLIQLLNGKRGLHIVVMYLVVGAWRVPWAFRPWRGKGTTTPAQLGLKLLRTLPKKLTRRFRVLVLADTGFSSVEFINGVTRLRYQAIVGIPKNRLMDNGKAIKTITKKGQQVKLTELEGVVVASWFYLQRNGKLEKRFVISTRVLKGCTITWWGRRRWAIEGFFKTAKYQFGLASFGQQTLLGVYRWLILSFISFLLTHWIYLSLQRFTLPDWKEASLLTLQRLLPKTVVNSLLIELESKRELLAAQGLILQLLPLPI
jgi:Transposase DDE domain